MPHHATSLPEPGTDAKPLPDPEMLDKLLELDWLTDESEILGEPNAAVPEQRAVLAGDGLSSGEQPGNVPAPDAPAH